MNVEMGTTLMGGGDTPTGQNSFAYQETRIILLYYLQSIIYRVRKQFTGSERLEPNTSKEGYALSNAWFSIEALAQGNL